MFRFKIFERKHVRPKILRLTTVAISMNIIMRGQLRHMNQYFEVVGVSSYDEKHFVECGAREGIRMHRLEMSRTIHPLRDLVSLWRLFILFLKERPTIVHTHTPKAGLLGMIAAWLCRVPVRMHTVGGLPLVETKGVKRSILNIAEKITYFCAQRVYPNSIGLQRTIIENRFCIPDKVRVLANGGSNGIDSEYFNSIHFSYPERERLRKDIGVTKDDFVFCFVGRIGREKGIRELVNAFQLVRADVVKLKTKLLLIGPFEATHGILDGATQERIRQDADIITPGRFDDVRPYYFLSDVYVFPSYREGFPNTLLEAGAMGLPTITTNISGCNEIVHHDVNGFLIAPKDTDALARTMKRLVLDDRKRRQLSDNAREFIVSKFSREVIWDAMLSEYNAMLKSVSVSK